MSALAREPDRSQNLALKLELSVLPAQPRKLLALGVRQPIVAATFIPIALRDPIANRLRRRLELLREFLAFGPARTRSVSLRRNSAGYGSLVLAIVNTSISKDQVSTKTGQLQ
jgi:hypothetical protein